MPSNTAEDFPNDTDTLVTPAIVGIDTKDNLEIKADQDLDGIGAVCDCAPDDEAAWSFPGAVGGPALAHEGGLAGATLTWTPPLDPGGSVVTYDTVVSDAPDAFGEGSATCIESADGTDTSAVDAVTPEPDQTRYFLVRARHVRGAGSVGTDTAGIERAALACP